MHSEHDDKCRACDTGRWVFLPRLWLERAAYQLFPRLWAWWANRGDSKKRFKEKFRSKRTGEKVDPFPNLQ